MINLCSMMLVALLILSFITCSLAQTACDTARQTLMNDTECFDAVNALISRNSTLRNETVRSQMMVCGGTTCSQGIRAYLDNCPVSIIATHVYYSENDSIAWSSVLRSLAPPAPKNIGSGETLCKTFALWNVRITSLT